MRIYLASSWRNEKQPLILQALEGQDHEVYDFRNPNTGESGFSWRQLTPHPPPWDPEYFTSVVLTHPIARRGFAADMTALLLCDVCVLLLPCGKSAHLELGWAAGAGKRTYVLMEQREEPELMYLMCTKVCTSLIELMGELK